MPLPFQSIISGHLYARSGRCPPAYIDALTTKNEEVCSQTSNRIGYDVSPANQVRSEINHFLLSVLLTSMLLVFGVGVWVLSSIKQANMKIR
jgi:hypothetical protein